MSSSSSFSANQDSTPSLDSKRRSTTQIYGSINADSAMIEAALARERLQETETMVQDFARTHPFWEKHKQNWSEEDIKEFASDVYTFSGEAGLSDNLAKVQVVRAITGWNRQKGIRKERQMDLGEVLEDNEIDPTLIAVERTRDLVELTSAGMSYQPGSKSPLKRKRGSAGSMVQTGDVLKMSEQMSTEALIQEKRQRKAEKKARQKAAKLEKLKREEEEKQMRVEQRAATVSNVPKLVLHNSQDWYKDNGLDEPQGVVVDAETGPTAAEPKLSVSKRKKAKKKKQATDKAAVLAANPDATPETMLSGAELREMKRENKRLKKEKKLEKKRARLGPETSAL